MVTTQQKPFKYLSEKKEQIVLIQTSVEWFSVVQVAVESNCPGLQGTDRTFPSFGETKEKSN